MSANTIRLTYRGQSYGLNFEDMQTYADVETLTQIVRNSLTDAFEAQAVVKVGSTITDRAYGQSAQ